MTINVAIAGASGRMGRALIRCMQSDHLSHLSLCGAFEREGHLHIGEDAGSVCGVGELGIAITASIEEAGANADVIIDFTAPTSTMDNVHWVSEKGKALVIGTTGLSDSEKETIARSAESAAMILAPNMSLGINLLLLLVNQAARALRGKGYDAEIMERHHRRKKDAPSGTALALGEKLADGYGWDLNRVAQDGRTGISATERPVEQIGFHAVRGGDIVGEHTVLFAGDGEYIELSHTATNRDTFAMGALQAAAWVAGKTPGLYSMKDVLEL